MNRHRNTLTALSSAAIATLVALVLGPPLVAAIKASRGLMRPLVTISSSSLLAWLCGATALSVPSAILTPVR